MFGKKRRHTVVETLVGANSKVNGDVDFLALGIGLHELFREGLALAVQFRGFGLLAILDHFVTGIDLFVGEH